MQIRYVAMRVMRTLVLCGTAFGWAAVRPAAQAVVSNAAPLAPSTSASPAPQVPASVVAALDRALRDYWRAADAEGRGSAVKRVLAAKAPFDLVKARLEAGRDYAAAKTGAVSIPTRVAGLPLDNLVEVPADYDPARRWPVRVSLHGGVGREAPGAAGGGRPLTNRTPSAGEIVIHPRAWAGAEWWTPGQVENIGRLLDRVKHDYNTDETRTYITGISDGGTGVYYFGMRAATPWAACLPLNGHPMVLTNPAVGEDEQFYAGNLTNCPLHVVNGGRDPLYPAASVAPLVEMLRAGRIPVSFQVYPTAGHNVNWWPEERTRFETFLAAHARVPHPDAVSWETDRTDQFNRFRWLVIDRLGVRPSDGTLEDVNTFFQRSRRGETLYARSRPSGRVDVVRKGNTFDAQTRGVQRFTLLLSPDVVDFGKPIRLTVNGRAVHDAVVTPSTEALLTWAARDDDRTMLYGAAVSVQVP